MNKPRILVMTAAGKTGKPIVQKLLGEGFPVTALVRKTDGRSDELKALGADVVVGSITDPEDMRRAMVGAKRAYFNTPLEAGHLKAASIFAMVVAEQKLESVVAMSQWLAQPYHPSLHTREVWLGDQIFGWLHQINVTTINVGFFADNDMQPMLFAAQFGVLLLPYGTGLNAPPSNEDIAAVIAEILARPQGHAGKTYRPTGPKLLAPTDIATVLSRVLGRKIRYINAPIPAFSKVMRGLGLSEYAIAQVEQYALDYQQGVFAVNAPTEVVYSITGRPPEDFETIARRYANGLTESRPRLSTQLRLMTLMALWMLRQKPKSSSHLAKNEVSDPKRFSLSAQSSNWQRVHRSTQ